MPEAAPTVAIPPWRVAARYVAFLAAFLAFLLVMGAAERGGIAHAWLGWSFLAVTVAVYATIGLRARTTDEVEYYVAGRRVPTIYNGMATAADWMSMASFVGTAGVLYLQGFGGLAYVLGWTGGYCLVAMLLAPYLRRFGQFTIPDFLAARYGGTPVRLVGVAAVMLVSVVYLVVQLYGVGLITSHLTGFSFEIGIFLGLGGVLVCSFLGGMRAVTWTQVAQYLILIVAFLVPVVWLSIQQTGHVLPGVGMAVQLKAVQAAEARLLADPAEQQVRALQAARAAAAAAKLADVRAAMQADAVDARHQLERLRAMEAPLSSVQAAERRLARLPRSEAEASASYLAAYEEARRHAQPLAGLPPHATPFAQTQAGGASGAATQPVKPQTTDEHDAAGSSRLNFLALVFCLTLGTAGMPHVLTRFYTTTTVRAARWSVMWTLLFVALLYATAPALAVFVKAQVFDHLVGMPFDQLPEWIDRWAHIDPGLVHVEDLNGDHVLQLGELTLGGDLIVLAAPEMAGLPYVVTCLVAAGGLAAALSTADGLLLTLANSLSHDVYFKVVNPRAPAIRRVMLSKVFVLATALLAAWLASLRLTDVLRFVAAAFSLAAATFFPALVLGIFWRRANRAGALAGMLAGLGVCLWYLVTTVPSTRAWLGLPDPQADARWFGLDPVVAGVFGVPVGFAVTILVSLLTPRSPRGDAVVDQVRLPAPPAPGQAPYSTSDA